MSNVEDIDAVTAFFKRVDHALVEKGWSRSELARRAGINNNTLQSFWKIKKYLPRTEYTVRVARALGTTVEYLVSGVDPLEMGAPDPSTRALLEIVRELPADARQHMVAALRTILAIQRSPPGKARPLVELPGRAAGGEAL